MNQIILALETSSQTGSVALVDSATVLHTEPLEEGLRHGTSLLPAAEACLAACDIARADLAAIAVGVGPGSYTGTRIGVMVAKAVAFGLNIPLLGISSLAALAYDARADGSRLVPLMDARRDEVYTAIYQRTENATQPLEDMQPDTALTPEDAAAMIGTKECMLVGSAVARAPDFWRDRCPNATCVENKNAPTAGAVGLLAACRLAQADVDSAMQLQPTYLRKEDSPAPFA